MIPAYARVNIRARVRARDSVARVSFSERFSLTFTLVFGTQVHLAEVITRPNRATTGLINLPNSSHNFFFRIKVPSVISGTVTKSEWADYAAVQEWCGNLFGDELTRNLSGNIRPQSSQLAEPLWADPGTRSEISVRELSPLLLK